MDDWLSYQWRRLSIDSFIFIWAERSIEFYTHSWYLIPHEHGHYESIFVRYFNEIKFSTFQFPILTLDFQCRGEITLNRTLHNRCHCLYIIEILRCAHKNWRFYKLILWISKDQLLFQEIHQMIKYLQKKIERNQFRKMNHEIRNAFLRQRSLEFKTLLEELGCRLEVHLD